MLEQRTPIDYARTMGTPLPDWAAILAILAVAAVVSVVVFVLFVWVMRHEFPGIR